jgi:hypothetical protein
MPENTAQEALRELEEMGVSMDEVVQMARVTKAQAEGKAYLIPKQHDKHGLTWELHGPRHKAFYVTLDRLDAIVELNSQLLALHEEHSKTRPQTKLRKAQ